MLQALQIPAVAMYALSYGFFKLVNYVLFFWLPFFLSRTFAPGTSNVISTLYDVGMMPGKPAWIRNLFGVLSKRAMCVRSSVHLQLCEVRVVTARELTLRLMCLCVSLTAGGIIVGVVSDLYGGRRACVIVSMLSMLCPLLYVFSAYSDVVSTLS